MIIDISLLKDKLIEKLLSCGFSSVDMSVINFVDYFLCVYERLINDIQEIYFNHSLLKEALRMQMVNCGFFSLDMTITEFVDDFFKKYFNERGYNE